jgi:HK97 gp10 family phage protein
MATVVRLDTHKLDAIIRGLPGRADQHVRATAEAISGRAKALAPVDTGALRASIHTEAAGALSQRVADGVEYGYFVELGTSRMSAQPFMTPAVEWVRATWVRGWADLFEAAA